MANLLLVDDDPDILRLLALRLSTAGHRVRSADGGEGALALFDAERPDLVITDLKMGGMDGLALFDAIQRRAPTLPVIVLTAHASYANLEMVPARLAKAKATLRSIFPRPI